MGKGGKLMENFTTENGESVNLNTDRRTSSDWLKIVAPDTLVLDPDGWDRTDFENSFYREKITYEEFQYRLMMSTVHPKGSTFIRSFEVDDNGIIIGVKEDDPLNSV